MPPRITPAYAGNTLWIMLNLHSKKDHPRLRGKYNFTNADMRRTKGSPPLTREIPPSRANVTPSKWDHPRLRGKYFSSLCFLLLYSGSPPLTREIRSDMRRHTTRRGITPAYAGNTLKDPFQILCYYAKCKQNSFSFFDSSKICLASLNALCITFPFIP